MTSSATIRKLETAVRHHREGDVWRAGQLYQEVLSDDPKNADAWHLQGLVQFASGDPAAGESNIRRAIELKPTAAEFKANLAAVLVRQNLPAEAEQLCREILQTNECQSEALTHLGTALRQQRRLGESLSTFRMVVEIERTAAALCNVGSVLIDLCRVDEAHQILLEARELGPQLPQIHINLAAIQRELGRTAEALQSLATAQELDPSRDEVHTNRGNLLLENGKPVEAIEAYQSGIALNSYSASAVSGLGRALQSLGVWTESLEAHRLAAELEPDIPAYGSSYLYALSLGPGLPRDIVARRHMEWGQRIEQKTPVGEHACDLVMDRALRIGYVSPDLRSHATMRFLFPLLKSHDQSEFQMFFYSETGREDETTQQVQKLAAGWCCTRPLSDDELARKIRRDRIDILVDLAGHTAENRLPVFARKPAPIQVSFLGYPTTTGLSRIDYFLTDAVREPDNPAEFFSEEPVFLPHGACCFEALNSPDVTPSPCLANGYVTFGSTHRPEKISPDAMRVWAHVLQTVPDARLLLFRDVFEDEALRLQMQERMQDAGIEMARVDFGWQLPDPHLQVYSKIDILLDVFPWGSGTVAYDAMWMGVPIPTIAGDRGACRATASMMTQCGLPEFVADSRDEYVRTVSGLAMNFERLAEVRDQLRPIMEKAVGDGKQFAEDIEVAYRSFWVRFVQATSHKQQERVL